MTPHERPDVVGRARLRTGRHVGPILAAAAVVGIMFLPVVAVPTLDATGLNGGPQRKTGPPRVHPTPIPVGVPRVLRAASRQLTLVAGGGEVKVVLAGQALESVKAAELVFNGHPYAGSNIRIVAARPTALEVAITVAAGVAEVKGLQLRLNGSTSPVLVPVSLLRFDVVRRKLPAPPPTLGPQPPLYTKQVRTASTPTPKKATTEARKRPQAQPLRPGATPTPTLVGLPGPVDGAAQIELDTEIWTEPRIQSLPPQGRASETIEITGSGLGVPTDPTKTQVSFYGGRWLPRVEGDVLSASYRSLRVEVPRGAVTGTVRVTTPGGQAESTTEFEPLYVLHYPPNIFTPNGGLGFMHFYDSVLFLVDGQNASLFQVSSEMQVVGFDDRYFTMDAYEQKIDAFVVKTTLRVRIPGRNRSDQSTIIRSHPLSFTVDGTNVVIDAAFESQGWEYIGEYETQDVLTGEIHWKHFMDIDINSLTMKVTIPLEAGPNRYQPIMTGEITGETTFTTRLSIFDSPPFEVDETPIKSFIEDDVDAKVHATFNSDGFRAALAAVFSRLVLESPTFEGVPIPRFEVLAASDGGFDIRAVLGTS